MGAVRKECSPSIENLVETHMRKLDNLKCRNLNSKQQNKQTHESEPFKGSLKIQAQNLLLKNSTNYFQGKRENSINGGNSLSSIRKHRKIRRGKKTKKSLGIEHWCPTEDDLKQRDPVVLVDGLQLTKEQISVCRFSDKFIPTPKAPIDVLDQMMGTYEWAERLRWHQFFYIK